MRNFRQFKRNSGFTLIELLVVIAIIGLLSSIVLASLNTARAKARDAKRIADFRQIQTAFALYYDKYGRLPNETMVGATEVANFNSMAQQLVAEGFLSSVPVNPSGNNRNYSYLYYPNPNIGGLLVVGLETMAPTTVAKPPSCRPLTIGPDWCLSTAPSNDYCICNPY